MDHLRQATQQTFNNSQNNKKLFFGTNLSPHATLLKPLWILSFRNKFIIGLCCELCWLYCREQRQCRQDNMNIIPIYYLCCTGIRPAWSHLFVECSLFSCNLALLIMTVGCKISGIWSLISFLFKRNIITINAQFEGVSSIQPWCWELLSSRHADNVSWCLTLSHSTRHVSAWNWGVLL